MGAQTNEPKTSPTLLRQLRNAEDHEAWVRFIEIYTPLIFHYCRNRGLQSADASDVAQEVLRTVSQNIQRFEYDTSRGTFRGWLFTVTRTKLINYLEKQRRHPPASGDTAIQRIPDPAPTPEESQRWEDDYHGRLFEWASDQLRLQLKTETWNAFWKTAVEGLSGQEVAQALGISVSSVYVARSRVTARLRDLIGRIDEHASSIWQAKASE